MKSILALIFTLSTSCSFGQNWIRTYCDTGGFGGSFAIETYDKGFLIGGSSSSSVNENSILYKTDVNGNILWQRTIGIPGSYTNIKAVCTTFDGGCAITGDITNKSFILKLNACGEKDWVKIYEANYTLASTNIYQMKDGGFVFNLTNPNYNVFSGFIVRVDRNGNNIWNHLFKSYCPVNLSLDNNDNVLVTGFSVFYTNDDGHAEIPSTTMYIAKFDSSGNQMYEGRHYDYRNSGLQTLASTGGNCLTFASDMAGDYFSGHSLNLFYWGTKGQLLWQTCWPDKDYSINNNPADFLRIGDSSYVFLITQLKANTNGVFIDPRLRLVKTISDTIIFNDTLYQTKFDLNPISIKNTSDGKFIMTGTVLNNNSPSAIFAEKINSNLAQDSFYSSKFNYDYLCGNIQDTGTIRLDHLPVKNLAVDEGINSLPDFSIYPNPAHDYLYIRSSELANQEVQIAVFNTLGNRIVSEHLNPFAGNLNDRIELNHFPKGVYFIEIRQGLKYSRVRFVVL